MKWSRVRPLHRVQGRNLCMHRQGPEARASDGRVELFQRREHGLAQFGALAQEALDSRRPAGIAGARHCTFGRDELILDGAQEVPLRIAEYSGVGRASTHAASSR